MATKFLDPGGDSGLVNIAGDNLLTVNGTISTTFPHGNHVNSIKITPVGGNAYTWCSVSPVVADAGARCSFYFAFDTTPDANLKLNPIEITKSSGVTCFGVTVTTAGKLAVYDKVLAVQATGTTVLSTNTYYRISVSYTITNATTNRIKVFIDGVLELDLTNVANVDTTSAQTYFGYSETAQATGPNAYFSDFYMDDSAALTDTGDIWVTAKRPISNGSANEFTTRIGAGGSGYGTGHSPQVNERALSVTNGWSISNTTRKTEEYTIEGKAVGDIDISTATIIDYMGWICAKVNSTANSPVHRIIVGGTATAKTMTTGAKIYSQITGSSSYPTGNTDIGMDAQYTTTPHLTSLLECGVVVAYIPATTSARTHKILTLGVG